MQQKETHAAIVATVETGTWRELRRFARYTFIGLSTFSLDLCILYFFLRVFETPFYPTVVGAFVLAASINYAISRMWVFAGTRRGVLAGYINFLGVALFAGLLISFLVWFLVQYTGIEYLYARVVVAAVVGLGNYLFNLVINFNVLGHELR